MTAPPTPPAAAPRARVPHWVWPTACAAVAFLIRVVFEWSQVLGHAVRFLAVDPWYNTRVIDYLAHNFPHGLSVDPYLVFPAAAHVSLAPLFTWTVACAAWIAGVGAPGPRLVQLVAAFAPPVLGAALIVAVYDAARRLFDRGTARAAAAVAAIIPGTFLERSLLGFTDHHVLEALLGTLLISATLAILPRTSWRNIVTAGTVLGLYLFTWNGGGLFVVILSGWVLVQAAIDVGHRRDPLLRPFLAVLAIGAAFVLLGPRLAVRTHLEIVTLIAGAVAIGAADALSHLWRRTRLAAWLYPVALGILAAAGLGAALALHVQGVWAVVDALNRFGLGATGETINEARPLLYAHGSFSILPIVEQFSIAGLVAPVALMVAAVAAVRTGSRRLGLLAVWSAAIFGLTLLQLRFSYYAGVNVAILTGWAIHRLWTVARDIDRGERGRVYRALAAVAVAGLIGLPSTVAAIRQAHEPPLIGHAWIEALRWMRTATPDPFGKPHMFLARYPRVAAGAAYPYPPGAYGVMTWWDYGYWIIEIAHRIPTANPTQAGVGPSARFFTATDPARALAILRQVGARYVVVDGLQLLAPASGGGLVGKFDAMAIWAGHKPSEYHDVDIEREPDGHLRAVPVYYPAYYRTMAARLFLFGGTSATPHDSIWAVRTRRVQADGIDYREIVARQPFANEQTARAFLDSQTGQGYRLVSLDPTAPCVSVAAVAGVVDIHDSPGQYGPLARPDVRIFRVASATPPRAPSK